MTDARFPDRWLSDRRIQRLSDSHFRAFITSLTWSVSNRTDGIIHPEDLALIPNFSTGAPQAFLDAGLWSPQATGWLIADYLGTQTSSEQLAANERQRAKVREKKARQRAAKATATNSTNTDVPGYVPRDRPRDVPRENPGQDRTGQAAFKEVLENPDDRNGFGVRCRYCDTELRPSQISQHQRGFCNRPACMAASRPEAS
jgi:hypothetical protein